MNTKNWGCLLMVLGMLVAFFALLFGFETVHAESLQDGTVTNTVTATPKGTSTPYPTNNNATPGAGSGCPQDYPTSMSASYYRNCQMCFAGKDNPLVTRTPTVTGTQATVTTTATATATSTPTGTWYGWGEMPSVTSWSITSSGLTLPNWSSATYCGRANAIDGVFYQFSGSGSNSFGYQTFENGTMIESWNKTQSAGIKTLFAVNTSGLISKVTERGTIGQHYIWGSGSRNIYANRFWANNGTFTVQLLGIVCNKYAINQATATPQPSPTPTKICVTPEKVSVKTTMDTFAKGLEYPDDSYTSYYHIFPYDVGAYRSLYERDFYNKQFEIDLNVSGATHFEFLETSSDVNVLYGKHKIDFFDCADRLVGTYTSTDGNDPTKNWTFTQPVSLCRVRVETIDNGLEKQFSSRGVRTDGCVQVNCSSTDASGKGYKFDKDSPIGIDIGGWAEFNQCRLLFEGFDMAVIRNPIQGLLDFANIEVTLPEFPNIPWIQLCVQYWRMPTINYFNQEIPIGNILLFIAVMFTFGSPAGTKGGK